MGDVCSFPKFQIMGEVGWGVYISKTREKQFQLSQNYIYCQNVEYTCLLYRFLESLTSPEIEYTVAITAFWAIEAVYQESFAHCLEDGSNTADELKETCQRWGNDEFSQYCKALANIAERCLEKAPAEVVTKAEVVFLRVLEHEVEFWNMSHRDLPL